MKKSIAVANILMQVCWYAMAGVATYFVTKTWLLGINQPWRVILGGLVFIVIVILLSIITNIIKATKDPDVKAASRFHLTMAQYRKFKTLFDTLSQDEMMNNSDAKELLYDVVSKNPKEWKSYCLSRNGDYKPFYRIGKEVYLCNESNKYIKGIITGISFGIEWWYYTIEFTEPVSINNSWPSEKVTVLAKTIMDIETNNIKCDDSHYVL
nr:MAG TPA: Protein transport protein [Caudoviricetes sp.]